MRRTDRLNTHHRAPVASRSDARAKKSEMLEIRVCLPLKQALAEHCRSTGVNRSAFVRAAIEERMARERDAAPAWILASGAAMTMVQSHARTFAAAGLIIVAGFTSALSLRPDERAMLRMLEIGELAHIASIETRADAALDELAHLSSLKEVR